MSVIAVKKYEDHVEIASDSQITHDMNRIQNITGFKLVQQGNMTIGFVGDATIPTFLRMYLQENPLPDMTLEGVSAFAVSFYDYVDKISVPEFTMGPSAFVFASSDKVIAVEEYFVFEVEDHYSIGVGVELCDALMSEGKTPLEVVIKTCKVNIYCSAPIEEYQLYSDRIDYHVEK